MSAQYSAGKNDATFVSRYPEAGRTLTTMRHSGYENDGNAVFLFGPRMRKCCCPQQNTSHTVCSLLMEHICELHFRSPYSGHHSAQFVSDEMKSHEKNPLTMVALRSPLASETTHSVSKLHYAVSAPSACRTLTFRCYTFFLGTVVIGV